MQYAIRDTQYEQRHTSTSVENPLQIDLFMQNKPKVKIAKINVSSFITSIYVKVDTWWNQKNKAKQTQFVERVKLMQSVYLQRIMKKNAAKGYEKTKPNKANLVRRRRIPKGQNELKIAWQKIWPHPL